LNNIKDDSNFLDKSIPLNNNLSNFDETEYKIRNDLKFSQENILQSKISEVQINIDSQKLSRTKLEVEIDDKAKEHNTDLKNLRNKCQNELNFELNRKDNLIKNCERT